MTLDRARQWLTRVGLPGADPGDPVASTARFADGGMYKWEVAGALDAASVAALADRLGGFGLRLHQATNTVGTMRYLDAQLTDLVQTCAGLGVQLRMAVGPRGLFDIGGQKLASGVVAAASAYRLRGTDQLAQAVDDVAHASDLGIRGFLVFDEGLLTVLARLRASGLLPAGTRLKASSNMGAANPAHVRLLAEAGADSVNVQRDLDVRMLAAIRAATPAALDVHTDNPRSTGGFVRGYDVPEIVRVAAPVYLKSGNAAQDFSDEAPSARQIDAIAHQILLDDQLLRRMFPAAVASDRAEF
ncbi:U32 family peptidase [Phytohabitans sp. ZYX-F-186]|uniref:U32 family peptidase n=1 Tax=Phytohabitans maris TaxID=3071409 RepID=A0ABU0ZSG8_9ACTN|nr:U32 family peptidase [Phytohabitans sp. ZYX-F-186]MDQ7909976.1 U32 family peptidase [Phytohabitans sp. ZYX-F-186]